MILVQFVLIRILVRVCVICGLFVLFLMFMYIRQFQVWLWWGWFLMCERFRLCSLFRVFSRKLGVWCIVKIRLVLCGVLFGFGVWCESIMKWVKLNGLFFILVCRMFRLYSLVVWWLVMVVLLWVLCLVRFLVLFVVLCLVSGCQLCLWMRWVYWLRVGCWFFIL